MRSETFAEFSNKNHMEEEIWNGEQGRDAFVGGKRHDLPARLGPKVATGPLVVGFTSRSLHQYISTLNKFINQVDVVNSAHQHVCGPRRY